MNNISIQKPYAISIRGQTIDGNESNTVFWSVSGGVQVSYSISILKLSDNTTAYTFPKTTSYATTHILPAISLTNGIDYKIQITTYDNLSNSASSDYDVFSTSSRPVISISTIDTIANSSNLFTATYSQSESVLIKSWIAYLYDSSSNKLSQSTIETSNTLSYLVSGLQNDTTYYIEFQATSEKGLIGSTGLAPFFVQFEAPNVNVNILAENTSDAGIKLTWNVSQIIGTSENATFISDEKLDVREGSVTFTPVSIPSDFTLKMWMESLSNHTISNVPEIIVSNTEPTNINALWLYDSAQTTPKIINVSIRNVAPTNPNDLWVVDSSQTVERVVGLHIDTTQPSNANYFWLNTIDKLEESSVLNLDGDNGSIKLEYFNSFFYLVSYDLSNVRTVLSSVGSIGTQFYIYIQQIGNAYNLGVEVIS